MPFPLFVFASMAIGAATMGTTALFSHWRWRWLAAASALTGATALLLFHGPLYFDYYADDAYITLRYSKHLAEGLGPNWNSDGRVEGYTNFLWMAILAGVGRLSIDLVDASRFLGFLSLVATFLGVFSIWKLWSDEAEGSALGSPLLLAAVLLGLALTDSVPFWGFSGMETPLFMALITGSAYLYFRERRGAPLPWSAVALATAAMTRPEGLIAAAVTGVFTLADAARATDRRQGLTRVLAWGGIFLALYGSYFVWRYNYYDYLLPNTYYAKVGLTAAGLDRGLREITTSGVQYHLLAMFVGTALLFASQRVRQDAAYIVAVTGLLVTGMVVEGDSGGAHSRFLVPVLPLLLLGGLGGFAVLLRRAAFPPALVVLVTTLGLGLGGLALLPNSYDPLVPLGREGLERRSQLGIWLNENTPPHYTIADFAVGAISYHASDRNFLDLLGLNDVVIAHTEIPDMGKGVPGHEKYNVDYVLEDAQPEIIVIGQVHARPLPAAELEQLVRASSLIKASAVVLTDPRLWERYTVRALNLDGRWHHFLQRNDTVAELQAPELK